MGQIMMKLVQSFVDLKSMLNASAIEIDPSHLMVWSATVEAIMSPSAAALRPRNGSCLMTPMWWRWAQPLRLSSRSV